MNNEIVIKQKKPFKDYLPSWLKNIHSMFYYFLFLILMGLVFFATSLVWNYFTTPFSGDYVLQQFAFYSNGYDDWWHFFTTGEFVLYDQNTFLGADNIGSNSFYYLFDPFFMPILLCPRQLIPQGMAMLTILKISASGMAFFLYMRYLGASRRASKITGLAYAFSGWMTWYLWFNHFTEVAIVLPLILLGVEMTIKEKQPWVLAGSLCLMGFTNFFFMVCFAMCGFLYAMFRYFQTIRTRTWKNNLWVLLYGFLGFLIGTILPMMVVLPAGLHAITAPRAASSSYLNLLKESLKAKNLGKIFKLLTNWTAINDSDQNKARLLYPFIDFAFPADTCRGTPLTLYKNDTYDNVAGSSYCFLPMMCLIVPAFMDSLKKKHFSVLVPLAFFIFALFTPAFYYLFHGVTEAYSRWTLFVTTSILAYTGLYLDKMNEKPIWHMIIGFASMMVMVLIAVLCAYHLVSKYPKTYEERVPIWVAAILEYIYLVILLVALVVIRTYKKPKFYGVFTGFIAAEIALMGAFVIQGHGVDDYYYANKGFMVNDALHAAVTKVRKVDKGYFRSFSSVAAESTYNDEMRNGYNGYNFFHSVYNFNTADICNWSSITGGTSPQSWSGNYIQKHPNLDTLLGVKYYYVEDDYYNYQNRAEASSEYFRYNVPQNYIDVTSSYGNKMMRVYQNMDYIDFALTYDTVFEVTGDPTKEYDNYSLYTATGYKDVLVNEEMYLKGALINWSRDENVIPEIQAKYPSITVRQPLSNSVYSYYWTVTMQGYNGGEVKKVYYDANITFYDIKSADRFSLGLSAEEYLTLCNPDNDTFDKYKNIPSDGKNNDRRWVGVIEANADSFPDYDPMGNIFYINAPFDEGHDVDIYLVDDTNKIVTYDNHNDGYFNGSRYGKEYRTFYTSPQYEVKANGELIVTKEAPKIKKIIIVSRASEMKSAYPILIDTYTKHKAKIDALKEYTVSDVKTSANTYKFKTNFEKNRIVVTRLAYEDGFKLTMKDANGKKQNVKVFNGQGGFVTFVSGAGQCSYTLEFYTPYLSVASYLSAVGLFFYMTSFVAYFYFELRRQEKENLLLFSK